MIQLLLLFISAPMLRTINNRTPPSPLINNSFVLSPSPPLHRANWSSLLPLQLWRIVTQPMRNTTRLPHRWSWPVSCILPFAAPSLPQQPIAFPHPHTQIWGWRDRRAPTCTNQSHLSLSWWRGSREDDEVKKKNEGSMSSRFVLTISSSPPHRRSRASDPVMIEGSWARRKLLDHEPGGIELGAFSLAAETSSLSSLSHGCTGHDHCWI